MKNSAFLMSMLFIFFLFTSILWAEKPTCHDRYCINVTVERNSDDKFEGNDLCYIVQVNGSSNTASGSIPVNDLPTVLFSVSNQFTSFGKPLDFRIIKAQIVSKGGCEKAFAQLQAVSNCKLMEFSTIAGVSRLMTLNQTSSNADFTCRVK